MVDTIRAIPTTTTGAGNASAGGVSTQDTPVRHEEVRRSSDPGPSSTSLNLRGESTSEVFRTTASAQAGAVMQEIRQSIENTIGNIDGNMLRSEALDAMQNADNIGGLRKGLAAVTTVLAPAILAVDSAVRATQNAANGALSDKPVLLILQPSVTVDGNMPGTGHKVAFPQVVAIVDPHNRDNITIQLIARHEIAGGFKLLPDSVSPFKAGATGIIGDEIGIEYQINLQQLRGRNEAATQAGNPNGDLEYQPVATNENGEDLSVSNLTLFRQSHARLEGSIPYGPSRMQFTQGAERVEVVKHDLQSAGPQRRADIGKVVLGENIAAGAALGALTPAIGDTGAHVVALGIKALARQAMNNIAPPNEINAYVQSHTGPIDFNPQRLGTPWTPAEGQQVDRGGATVNFYLRYQSNTANANGAERWELLREEDLNTQIEVRTAKLEVVRQKLEAVSQHIEQSIADLNEAEAQENRLMTLQSERQGVLDGLQEEVGRVQQEYNAATEELNEMHRHVRDLMSDMEQLNRQMAATSDPAEKMQIQEDINTRLEQLTQLNSISERIGANLTETANNLEHITNRHEQGQAQQQETAGELKKIRDEDPFRHANIEMRNSQRIKLDARQTQLRKERAELVAEQRNLIERGMIPADTHNDTHYSDLEDPQNPSRSESIQRHKVDRHNRSVSQATVDENRKFPGI